MKRVLSLFLIFALTLSLSGCFSHAPDNPVRFYYLRDENHIVYGSGDGMVTYEQRDVSGHADDLRYLIPLYLQGPLDEGLVSPFPTGSRLLTLSSNDNEITLVFNEAFARLKGIDLSLAYVCLVQTCTSLADIQSVHILVLSDNKHVLIDEIITIDSLPALDATVPNEGST